MRPIRKLADLDVSGKRVFLRVDLNVPLDGGRITDDTRVRAAVPTLRELLDRGASVVCCSHLGRPRGEVIDGLSLEPVAHRIEALIDGVRVAMAGDAAGEDASAKASALLPGQVLLLENIRFEPGETKGERALADRLRSLADVYVNDAFGAAHRAHASVSVLAGLFEERAMGLLMERELHYLIGKLGNPKRPYAALLGGAKVSDKIPVLESLVERVDCLCIGGAMANTFLKAQGVPVGLSRVEGEREDAARTILNRAGRRGVTVDLPVDHRIAPSFEEAGSAWESDGPEVPDGYMSLDIGPRTAERFASNILESGTVLWNGPMGVFEKPPCCEGTFAVARAVAKSDALSVVGGGDSVSAVNAAGVAGHISHISTGGGASLELLSGRKLPGLEALES